MAGPLWAPRRGHVLGALAVAVPLASFTVLSATSRGGAAPPGLSSLASTGTAGVGALALETKAGAVTTERLTGFSLAATADLSAGPGSEHPVKPLMMSATATLPVDSVSAGALLVATLERTPYASATVTLENLAKALSYKLGRPVFTAHLVQTDGTARSVEATIVFTPPPVTGPTPTTSTSTTTTTSTSTTTTTTTTVPVPTTPETAPPTTPPPTTTTSAAPTTSAPTTTTTLLPG